MHLKTSTFLCHMHWGIPKKLGHNNCTEKNRDNTDMFTNNSPRDTYNEVYLLNSAVYDQIFGFCELEAENLSKQRICVI